MTHRQFLAWQVWLEMQWDVPDRHDNYLMQVGQKVERLWHKRPREVTMERQKLQFKMVRGDPKPQMSQQDREAAQLATDKARWLGRMVPPKETSGNRT